MNGNKLVWWVMSAMFTIIMAMGAFVLRANQFERDLLAARVAMLEATGSPAIRERVGRLEQIAEYQENALNRIQSGQIELGRTQQSILQTLSRIEQQLATR